MYDYGARFYMPDIGRWGVVDMLNAFTLDSYGYANNNPIFFNDPTGMIAEGTDPNDPNRRGGENNPIAIEEVKLVHINKNRTTNKTVDYSFNMPSNCMPCYSQQNQRIDLGPLPIILKPLYQRPNGSIMMMSGDVLGLSDLLGMLLSKVETKNRYAMMSVGLLAILATKGKVAPGIAETELAMEKAEVTTLYRSVSPAELKDIASNGLRSGGGSYEFFKLFTTSETDAAFFSKNLFKSEGNTIIKVEVQEV